VDRRWIPGTLTQEDLDLPFKTTVLGVEVIVERVDMNESKEIVVVCRNGRTRQRVALLDLPLPSPLPRGSEWIEAYRHWHRGVK
jgi:hypothetical protein